MKREELDFVLEQNQYLEGGTKEACVKVRNFLRYATTTEDQVHAPRSCVTAEEFVESVKILMAFAFREKDTIAEQWRCDKDCQMVSYLLCPGECNLSIMADKKCPFFEDETYV